MSLNTDSYRSATAFRISQLVDPSISDPVKLHLADVLRGQVEMLINEVERLRAIIARMDEVAPRADDTLAAARNAAPALLRAIKAGRECADDLESVLRARYEGTLDYPSQRQRFERDMEPVLALRAALAALEEGGRGE